MRSLLLLIGAIPTLFASPFPAAQSPSDQDVSALYASTGFNGQIPGEVSTDAETPPSSENGGGTSGNAVASTDTGNSYQMDASSGTTGNPPDVTSPEGAASLVAFDWHMMSPDHRKYANSQCALEQSLCCTDKIIGHSSTIQKCAQRPNVGDWSPHPCPGLETFNSCASFFNYINQLRPLEATDPDNSPNGNPCYSDCVEPPQPQTPGDPNPPQPPDDPSP